MKIALCQINPTVGDLAGNAALLVSAMSKARAQGAELALFPELSLLGYPPNDLLERRIFVDRVLEHEAKVIDQIPAGLTAIFGTLTRDAEGLFNTAVVADKGRVLGRAHKMLLPVYDVFDEARYFRAGAEPLVVKIGWRSVGVTICEDVWNDKEFWDQRRYAIDPVEKLAEKGVDLIVNLSSSPWCQGKEVLRREMVSHMAVRHRVPVAYVNQFGGNDALIFDGNSIAFDGEGRLTAQAKAFEEDIVTVDIAAKSIVPRQREVIEDIHDALVLGIRDYFAKLSLSSATIALSGGIDSAVTAYLAVEALGKGAVAGIGMPSRYSSKGSVDDARELADNLGIPFHLIEIEPVFAAYLEQLAPVFAGAAEDVTEENLQARIRGTFVMAYANKMRSVVLTTGNKSESAVGYCTLYGDTNGGLAPIADLYKEQVYELARFANRKRVVIPVSTIDKVPSAELRPNQKDSDSLPPYPVLDKILKAIIEESEDAATISKKLDVPTELVDEIIRKIYAAEFKRRQFPPTLRVSQKAWAGRVYPIAHRFKS